MLEWIAASSKNGKITRNNIINIIQEEMKDISLEGNKEYNFVTIQPAISDVLYFLLLIGRGRYFKAKEISASM